MDSTTHRDRVPPGLRLGLRNYWYPVIDSAQVGSERSVPITRLGEKLVVWRDASGDAHVLVDRCAHRSAPLSAGDLVNGRIQCRYHGAQYDGTGQCRLVPIDLEEDGKVAQRMKVLAYPVEERAGFIWAYLGDIEEFPPEPLSIEPPIEDPSYVSVISETVWDANWLLVHDNTIDPLHVGFLHGYFTGYIEDGTFKFGPAGPGNPGLTPETTMDAVVERYLPHRTGHGVRFLLAGKAEGDESTSFDEVEFVLPCIAKVWVPFPDGGHPHRILQYEYPIDEDQTIVYAWIGKQIDREEDREASEYTVKKFSLPVALQVYKEDSWMCNAQGDVDYAYEHESLFPSDVGIAAVRQCILDAFEARGKRGGRVRSDNGQSELSTGDSQEVTAR